MIRAVFGGSFDPVHTGHRLVAREILEQGLADVVHVIPALVSPHKTGHGALADAAPGASSDHRLAMVRLVFEGKDRYVIETLELDRPAPSFTVDTLSELADRHPEDHFRIVIGADQLMAFGQWRSPGEILKQGELIVVARQAGDLSALCEKAGVPTSSCHLLTDFDELVSGTAIRAKLQAGEAPGPELDPIVARYIRDHGLYRE